MLERSFVIQDIHEAYGEIYYIWAQPATEEGFYVTESSTSGGMPIHPWVEISRSRGVQKSALRNGFFAFALRRATDVQFFSHGDRVVLKSPDGVRVCRQCGAKVPRLSKLPEINQEIRTDKIQIMNWLKAELGLESRAAKAWATHLCNSKQLCHKCVAELPKGNEVTCRHCDALNVRLLDDTI